MQKFIIVVSNGIKDTNLKANHNSGQEAYIWVQVVSNGIKDTNLKANHNSNLKLKLMKSVVSNGIKDTNLKANHNISTAIHNGRKLFPMVSKILIWKQITTCVLVIRCLFLLFPMVSKILIWKQITTFFRFRFTISSCFQWYQRY